MIFFYGINSCESDNQSSNYKIIVSPEKLVISDYDSIVKLYISTQPGFKTKFTFEEMPEWITVSAMNGSLNGGIYEIGINPKADTLKQGIYNGKLKIRTTENKIFEISVSLSVKLIPRLKTNLTQLLFSSEISELDISLQNVGSGYLNWSVVNLPDWLSISQNQGYLFGDENVSVKVKVNKQKLDPNTYISSLVFFATNSQTITIPVTVVVPDIYSIETTKKNVIFDYFQDDNEIILKNTGNQSISWSSNFENYYSLSPSTGSLSKGDSTKIRIVLNRTGLQTATYTSDIVFRAINTTFTLSTSVKNFTGTKKVFNFKIIDAEFCEKTNKIITVSANPNTLSIIDPLTNTIETVALNLTPTCVSINKLNTKAVVGHKGKMSLIDLTNKKLEKEYDILCEPLDILLSSSDWVYICPGFYGESNTKIHCLDLSTGKTTLSTFKSLYFTNMIYARLDPTEKYLYGISYNSFPSDLHKFDISNGVADYLYDSPYHGDHEMSDNLWLTEDGDKIFTKGNSVFKTSTIKDNDLIYTGNLSNSYSINSLFHSKINNKVFVVNSNNNIAYSYNYSTLTSSNQYPLENFLVKTNGTSGTLISATGKFIFVNNSGTDAYVLTQSASNDVWALQSFKIN